MKKLFFATMFFLLILLFPSIVIPYIPEKVSDFYYRELTYSKIAEDLKGDTQGATLINMFEYVANNLHTFKNSKVVDYHSFNDAIRGVGWCDQQAFLLMHLLNKSGISRTRLRDVQGHTFSEVKVGNKWVVVDPYSSLIFLDVSGKYLGIDDLKNTNIDDLMGVIKSSKKSLEILTFSNNYQNIFIKNEVRWKNGIGPEFLDYRSYNLMRRLLEFYGKYAFSFFGDSYYNWVQDKYLESDRIKNMGDQGSNWIRNYLEINDDAFRLFYKARNYDLSNRDNRAAFFYKQIIEQFKHHYWAKEAKYYLSIIEYKNKNYSLSKTLLLDLLANYESVDYKNSIGSNRNDHNDLVEYYLGLISLKGGNIPMAKEYFLLSDYKHSSIELYKIDSYEY